MTATAPSSLDHRPRPSYTQLPSACEPSLYLSENRPGPYSPHLLSPPLSPFVDGPLLPVADDWDTSGLDCSAPFPFGPDSTEKNDLIGLGIYLTALPVDASLSKEPASSRTFSHAKETSAAQGLSLHIPRYESPPVLTQYGNAAHDAVATSHEDLAAANPSPLACDTPWVDPFPFFLERASVFDQRDASFEPPCEESLVSSNYDVAIPTSYDHLMAATPAPPACDAPSLDDSPSFVDCTSATSQHTTVGSFGVATECSALSGIVFSTPLPLPENPAAAHYPSPVDAFSTINTNGISKVDGAVQDVQKSEDDTWERGWFDSPTFIDSHASVIQDAPVARDPALDDLWKNGSLDGQKSLDSQASIIRGIPGVRGTPLDGTWESASSIDHLSLASRATAAQDVHHSLDSPWGDIEEEQRNLGPLTPIRIARAAPSARDAEHDDIRRPFKCTQSSCQKSFARRFNLTIHMKTHDPCRARDYVCNYLSCGKAFHRKPDMIRHIKTVHHEMPRGKAEPRSKGGECEECGKHFERKDSLRRHAKTCYGTM